MIDNKCPTCGKKIGNKDHISDIYYKNENKLTNYSEERYILRNSIYVYKYECVEYFTHYTTKNGTKEKDTVFSFPITKKQTMNKLIENFNIILGPSLCSDEYIKLIIKA